MSRKLHRNRRRHGTFPPRKRVFSPEQFLQIIRHLHLFDARRARVVAPSLSRAYRPGVQTIDDFPADVVELWENGLQDVRTFPLSLARVGDIEDERVRPRLMLTKGEVEALGASKDAPCGE